MDWTNEYEEETGFTAYEFGGIPKRGYVEWLEDELNQRLKDGKWICVEQAPLADITIKRDGTSTTVTYDNFLAGIDMLFAVPIGDGEYSICRGYITEEGDIYEIPEDEWWGYSLEDVTHYVQIFNPKPSQNT